MRITKYDAEIAIMEHEGGDGNEITYKCRCPKGNVVIAVRKENDYCKSSRLYVVYKDKIGILVKEVKWAYESEGFIEIVAVKATKSGISINYSVPKGKSSCDWYDTEVFYSFKELQEELQEQIDEENEEDGGD